MKIKILTLAVMVAAVVGAVEECPRVVLAERLAESVEAGKIMSRF